MAQSNSTKPRKLNGEEEEDTAFFATIGDIGNVINLIGATAYVVAAGTRIGDPSDTWFDEDWKKYGFCLTNPDVPYLSSHDMAFYVDLVAASILFGLYLALRKAPGMDLANRLFIAEIPGIVIHGVYHAFFGRALRRDGPQHYRSNNSEFDDLRGEPWYMYFVRYIVLAVLMKNGMPNVDNAFVVLSIVVARNAMIFVPHHFEYTCFQTVLLLAFSLNQLLRPKTEKDFHYGLYSILVLVPVTLVGWIESTQCSVFVRDKLYGHTIYDGFTAFALLIWYLLCYSLAAGPVAPPAPKVKTE